MRRLWTAIAVVALVLGLLGGAPTAGAADAYVGPGYAATDNVEWLANIPVNTDSAGAQVHDGWLYVTEDRGLSIYDLSNPELPLLTGFTPLPQMPYYTEEDVDTNGEILLIGSYGDVTDGVGPLNRVFVIDVTDKRLPTIRSWVDNANAHTISCIADCTYAYGSNGKIIDLTDPDNPVLLGRRWTEGTPVSGSHDVTEVAPGRVVTSSNPLLLLDTTDPADPQVLAQGSPGDSRFIHGNLWPQSGTDRYLLVGGETGGNCSSERSGAFMTFDASGVGDPTLPAEQQRFTMIDEYRVFTGLPLAADGTPTGNSPYDQFCAHWFDTHPDYADGGLVAMAWYEHGTRFLDVDPATGKITEVGWFYPAGGSTSAAYWITDEIVYTTDYQRGIDILRFTGTPAGDVLRVPAAPGYEAPATRATRAVPPAVAAARAADLYACPLPTA